LQTVLTLGTGVLAPLALAGLLADWLQTGPLWSLQRLAPRVDHLNPLAGLRRMASGERWVEVLKSLSKTLAFLVIGWLSVRAVLDPLSRLPWQGRPHDLGHALWQVGSHILLATLGVMFLLSLLDWLDQRRRLMTRLRMTRQEVRQEAREQEGDPHFKAHRRQAHQAWSQNAAVQSARQAHVLLVNPTHVAVAVDYDRLTCPVPTVCAKGLDGLALAMREAAEEAGVPIVRNVALARGLHERAEVGDLVPSDLFAVMAEVILWAREARAPRGLPSKDDGVARSGGVADSSADG
jgi:flagellar biosynthesis protein FlhB